MFISEKCHTARYRKIGISNMASFGNNINQLLVKYRPESYSSDQRTFKPRAGKNHFTEQIMVNCDVVPSCPQIKFY